MIKKIPVWYTDTAPGVYFTTQEEAVEEEMNRNKSYVSDLIALIDKIQSEYNTKQKELDETFVPTLDALHKELDDLMKPDSTQMIDNSEDYNKEEAKPKATVTVKVRRIKN